MKYLKDRLSKAPIHIILIISSAVSIFPLYYIITTAFKDQQEHYYNVYAPPAKWTFANSSFAVYIFVTTFAIYFFTQFRVGEKIRKP